MEFKALLSHYWINNRTGEAEKRGWLAQIFHKAMMTFSNVQCAKFLNEHCLILLQKSRWRECFPAVQIKKGLCVWVLNQSVIVRSNGNAAQVSLGCLLSLSLLDGLMVIFSSFERERVDWALLRSSDPQSFSIKKFLTSLYLSNCLVLWLNLWGQNGCR